MTGQEILEHINENYPDEELLYPTEYIDAIAGIGFIGSSGPVILMDRQKILDRLIEENKADPECEDPWTDAIEHFDFNIQGAYVGEKTPIFCDFFKEEEDGDSGREKTQCAP